MNSDTSKIKEILNERFMENEPLSSHTTFRIGGPARYFAVIQNLEEFQEVLSWAEKNAISYVVLGGGSNILVSDNGYSGLVIKMSGDRLNIKDEIVECEAGVILAKALSQSLAEGLSGLEWAAGIPGTIGGAVRGNAGAYGSDMGKNIIEVKVLRDGKIKFLSVSDCEFGYRESVFKKNGNKDVILSVTMKLQKSDTNQARERVKKIISERAPKFAGFSAGCVFKNIETSAEEIKLFQEKFPNFPDQYVKYRKIPVAWLIDKCELKGKEIGHAKVFENHAGIIINIGGATAENVIMLISIIKQKVRDTFDLQLMEEIEYLGF